MNCDWSPVAWRRSAAEYPWLHGPLNPPHCNPPPPLWETVTLMCFWHGVVVLCSVVLCVLVPTIRVDSLSRSDTNVCHKRLCLGPLSPQGCRTIGNCLPILILILILILMMTVTVMHYQCLPPLMVIHRRRRRRMMRRLR